MAESAPLFFERGLAGSFPRTPLPSKPCRLFKVASASRSPAPKGTTNASHFTGSCSGSQLRCWTNRLRVSPTNCFTES
jgi:hypothetical protein